MDDDHKEAPDIGLGNDLKTLRDKLVMMVIDQGGRSLSLKADDVDALLQFLTLYSDHAYKLEALAYQGYVNPYTKEHRELKAVPEEDSNIVRLVPKFYTPKKGDSK